MLNKHSLLDTLRNLSSYCGGEERMSIGIIDFDDFKAINDQFGHLIGDQVLKEFTHVVRKSLRHKDIIGRYGGEEFMLILPDATISQAAMALQRIHRKLRGQFHHGMDVAFSAGFLEVSSEELLDLDAEDIIHRVDDYLYQAKKAGKRRFVSENFVLAF